MLNSSNVDFHVGADDVFDDGVIYDDDIENLDFECPLDTCYPSYVNEDEECLEDVSDGFGRIDGDSKLEEEFSENCEELDDEESDESARTPFEATLTEEDLEDLSAKGQMFDNKDIGADLNKLNMCMSAFEAENWAGFNFEEKRYWVSGLADYLAHDVLGLNRLPKKTFYNMPENITGEYTAAANSINFNGLLIDKLGEKSELIKAIGHECWHAYQYQRAKDHPEEYSEDRKYLENPRRVNKHPWLYKRNRTEKEAESFGEWLAEYYQRALETR